jgi:hypothetical protein
MNTIVKFAAKITCGDWIEDQSGFESQEEAYMWARDHADNDLNLTFNLQIIAETFEITYYDEDGDVTEEITEDFEIGDCISEKTIETYTLNDGTEELLTQVQQYFGGKYTTQNGIKLRVADHSPCGYSEFLAASENETSISVIIANHDVTKWKSEGGYTKMLFFNSDNTFDFIIEKINLTIAVLSAQE